MEFRIADTFTASLGRLSSQEQKAVKITAMDLQLNPASPGHSFHKLDRAQDKSFWSVRVNDDVRLIVHRTDSSLLLAYVDHHDAAYRWAERRRIERHPKTGAAQLVELRPRVEDRAMFSIAAATGLPFEQPRLARLGGAYLFEDIDDDRLLGFGVPPEWIDEVRRTTEESLFDLAAHLPQEAMEALLQLATGGTPELTPPIATDADPFSHPDAQRRFRAVASQEELERALEAPWERWAVFLHPSQRRLVERTFAGPVRVSGSAGTGKTIVALHRAVHLARQHPQAKVLLTTFTSALANALQARLRLLVGNEPAIADRITVRPMSGIAYELYTRAFGQPNIVSPAQLRAILDKAAAGTGGGFAPPFLWAEWSDVVDAWQLGDWAAYRDVPRLGRRTRLGSKQREHLWRIFEGVQAELAARKLVTWPGLFGRLASSMDGCAVRPFDFAVVDESQDLGVAEARFLAALSKGKPDCLFFAGDQGQRIFQQPFSWRSLGLDVRGRSHGLRINYRTSQQIRVAADRLLPAEIADVDGNTESRRGTVSVLNGPPPTVQAHGSEADENAAVAAQVRSWIAGGIAPEEIGIFLRAAPQLPRARAAAKLAGVSSVELSEKVETTRGHLSIGTMHLAKGLEFRAVVVMACDDEVIPLQERIEGVSDEADLEEVYASERHLLYVACTRARDHLLVSAVRPESEFLSDLRTSG
jgi:mRNA-degrading endonuclease RelE of RelBE toxin-antitoxin system